MQSSAEKAPQPVEPGNESRRIRQIEPSEGTGVRADKKRRPRATPVCCPSDWQPDAKTRAWIEAFGVPFDTAKPAVAEFVGYWSERTTKRADWQQTFRRNGKVEATTDSPARRRQPRPELPAQPTARAARARRGRLSAAGPAMNASDLPSGPSSPRSEAALIGGLMLDNAPMGRHRRRGDGWRLPRGRASGSVRHPRGAGRRGQAVRRGDRRRDDWSAPASSNPPAGSPTWGRLRTGRPPPPTPRPTPARFATWPPCDAWPVPVAMGSPWFTRRGDATPLPSLRKSRPPFSAPWRTGAMRGSKRHRRLSLWPWPTWTGAAPQTAA